MTSDNETTSDSSLFVLDPINDIIKISLVFPTIIGGLYGLIANSFILYFMHKKRTRNYQIRAFSRSSLIDRFIQSLALSDVLCSVISLPVYIAEILNNYIDTDATCRTSRYVMFFFPVVTIMNYLFIGIERYLGVYHPLKVPSQVVCKRLIVVAWILGAVFSGLAIPSYGLVRYDLSDGKYTLVCKYQTATKTDRALFLSFTFFIYIIPSIILTTTCILILKFLRRFRRRNSAESSRSHCNTTSNSTSAEGSRSRSTNLRRLTLSQNWSRSSTNSNASGYRVTSMFVSLIFAFIIPYMLFIFYNGIVIALNLKMSFIADYVVRMTSGVLIYANGAVGSSILFYNSTYLKEQLESLLIKLFVPRVCSSSDNGIVLNSLPGVGRQTGEIPSEVNKNVDTHL